MAKRKPGRWPPPGIPTNFSNPIRDGAVLPILHLNGYKIANPTMLARITPEELEDLFNGYGWTPHVVEGDDPEADASADGGARSRTASSKFAPFRKRRAARASRSVRAGR